MWPLPFVAAIVACAEDDVGSGARVLVQGL
jgi:hypothetical protein